MHVYSSYRLVVHVIDVLQCRRRTDLAYNSGKQTVAFFSVVLDDHEQVCGLQEQHLHPFPGFCKRDERGLPVLLAQPVGTFQPDIGGIKQVKLHLYADVGLVPEYAAIVIQELDVFDIVYVMYACL